MRIDLNQFVLSQVHNWKLFDCCVFIDIDDKKWMSSIFLFLALYKPQNFSQSIQFITTVTHQILNVLRSEVHTPKPNYFYWVTDDDDDD